MDKQGHRPSRMLSHGWLCLVTDGVLLESSGHLLISSTLKNFQLLTILVVREEDLGTYTCCVSNPLGTAVTTGILRKAGVWCTLEVSTRPRGLGWELQDVSFCLVSRTILASFLRVHGTWGL